MRKAFFAAACVAALLPVASHATDLKIVCPSACTVTLPAATWDAIGSALGDAITVRQNLFSDISRQLREQMPAPPAEPARSPEEGKPSEPPPK